VLPSWLSRSSRGANPADIPIEQPSHFTFEVKMNIAKALGIKIPLAIMVQAIRAID
jgi:putative ABC transport system substrate-binding protein